MIRHLIRHAHSRPYEIFCRFVLLFCSSSSSAAFFFFSPGFVPFVGWLDSRVGNDEVGAGACDGVAEPGVDDSWKRHQFYCLFVLCAAARPGIPSRTLKKLDELRLNILSASLMGAFRLVALPAPPAVVVVSAPLM